MTDSTAAAAAARGRVTRRLTRELRRLMTAQPLAEGVRVDVLVRHLLDKEAPRRPPRHRGAGLLELDAAGIVELVDDLVVGGTLLREGHRVRLAGWEPPTAPETRQRIDRLMAELRNAGATPPRADAVARRIGLAPAMLDGLRRSGRLVPIGSGIDLPAETLAGLLSRIDELAHDGRLTEGRVRDALGTTRRHAHALLRHRSLHFAGAPAERDSGAVR